MPSSPQVSPVAILGQSPAIRRALALAEAFARSNLPILLVGETGTGKELFAQAIHHWSGQSGQLVGINCGALPKDLVEGELFGHRRGAFTGAIADRGGLLSAAAGGTLFLDEVISLPAEAQIKLLRVLDSGEVRRLGDSKARYIKFGVVSAAHPEIEAEVRSAAFRLDLYERLAHIVIPLPPLSERQEDIAVLAHSFAAHRHSTLEDEAVKILERHSWPGNVRELQAVVDRAVILAPGRHVRSTDIQEAIGLGRLRSSVTRSRPPVDDAPTQGQSLEELCYRYEWRSASISKALGISRATLFRRLRKSGLSLRAHRAASQATSAIPGAPRFPGRVIGLRNRETL